MERQDAANADDGNSEGISTDQVVVFERLPEVGLAAWYDLAVPLILLTLLLLVLFAGSAAILVWLCHRPRGRCSSSKGLSEANNQAVRQSTIIRSKPELLIRQNSTIDHIDETPSLSPLRISQPIVPAHHHPTVGSINKSTMRRPRITQTDLSTPPLHPPQLSLTNTPIVTSESSPIKTNSAVTNSSPVATSLSTSRRFTFNTSEVSTPTEWILHDAATIQPALAQADICCVQPPMPPISKSQSSSNAFRYDHYFRSADVAMALTVDNQEDDDEEEEEQEIDTDLQDNMQRLQLLPPEKKLELKEVPLTIMSSVNANRRRARLKSISLDSDGARLVEENLGEASTTPQEGQEPRQDHEAMESEAEGDGVVSTEAVNSFDGSTSSSSSAASSSSSEPTTPKKRRRRNLSTIPRSLGPHTTSRNVAATSVSSSTSLNHMLSASTNNLKTLPEVMTLTDFDQEACAAFVFPSTSKSSTDPATSRNCLRSINHSNSNNCIVNRRGSNQSLSHAHDQNTSHQLQHPAIYQPQQLSASNYNLNAATATPSNNRKHKQNLLQRRGSNTSLTLNIQPKHPVGSANSLNRFNSHSSLNISNNVQNQMPIMRNKGLLERRNSNASLTLTIQSRAASLSISNCNLMLCASSECSLASNPNQPHHHESMPQQQQLLNTPCPLHGSEKPEQNAASNTCGQHRRFLSSENINLQNSIQEHQHHHSSASDLKTTPLGNVIEDSETSLNGRLQCTCPILRNITTKPLSPQTTSEDFKIYLANIQMLQNASNVLTPGQLSDLGQIFERSYKKKIDEFTTVPETTATFKTDPEPIQQPTSGSHRRRRHQFVIDSDDTTIVLGGVDHPSSESASYTSTSSSDDEPPPKPISILPPLPPTPPVLSSPLLRGRPPSFPPSPLIPSEPPLPSAATTTINTTSDDDRQKTLLRQLHQEFWDLPTNYQEKPLVFGSQAKNRYKTILPNEHSRVLLEDEDDEYHETEANDENTLPAALDNQSHRRSPYYQYNRIEPYINANYIRGPDYTQNNYIATQGPLPNTIYEFWLMVQQNVRRAGTANQCCQKIAMLTDLVENGRQKCAAYFPVRLDDRLVVMNTARPGQEHLHKLTVDAEDRRPSTQLATFEGNCFVVQNQAIIVKNGYTIRKLRVRQYSAGGTVKAEFIVYHYWFPDWPDHRSPRDIDVLLDLSLDLLDGRPDDTMDQTDQTDPLTPPPLPIIHCSAGIGRTGCLAAILNGLRQMRVSNTAAAAPNTSITSASSATVDVLGIVCNLRLQRGGMVQNSEQYELIHRALCLYHRRTVMLAERALIACHIDQ